MERTKETLEARVRETPLVDRLKECQQRIGNMCAELRGPKMSIPVEYYDDDFYICTTLADAQATVEALQAQLVTLKRHAGLDCGDQSCLYALAHSGMRTNGGCRCSPKRMKDDLERSRKAVEALQRENACKDTLIETLQAQLAQRGEGRDDGKRSAEGLRVCSG